jgi:hypothetical protein
MFQFLIGPSRVGRTIGTRSSTRRPPRTTPGVIVLPTRTSEISRLSTDTSPMLVPLAETRMSPEAGLAFELPEQSSCGYDELSTPGAWATGDVLLSSASRIFASWNQLDGWLRQVEGLRLAGMKLHHDELGPECDLEGTKPDTLEHDLQRTFA